MARIFRNFGVFPIAYAPGYGLGIQKKNNPVACEWKPATDGECNGLCRHCQWGENVGYPNTVIIYSCCVKLKQDKDSVTERNECVSVKSE